MNYAKNLPRHHMGLILLGTIHLAPGREMGKHAPHGSCLAITYLFVYLFHTLHAKVLSWAGGSQKKRLFFNVLCGGFRLLAHVDSPGWSHCRILKGGLTSRISRWLKLLGNEVRATHVLRVGEALELNQLKSAPSQLLPFFSGFDRLQTCCHSFALANNLWFFFKCRLISSLL